MPLALQCVYGCSDERSENGDGEDWSEISGGGGGRVEIAYPLECRWLGFVWRVVDGGTFS